jgi:hypothetical protein
MARRGLLLFIVSCLALGAGCGKKGPIQPPLQRIPQAVEDLSVVQRGAALLLTWTNPSAYVDGNPLGDVTEVEIWIIREDRKADAGPKTWTVQDFESKAQLLARIAREEFASLRPEGETQGTKIVYRYALSGEDTGGKALTFSLRASDQKKKSSEFAEPATFEPVKPPSTPGRVRAVVFEDHIQLSWESPERDRKEGAPPGIAGFNLYRSDGTGPASRLNSTPLKKTEFPDKDFTFGQTYRYFVRSVLEGASPVESDDSGTIEVMARDVFAPAPPSGLTAISGGDFIALSWEAGRESDLAGYKVWRRIADKGDFVLVAQLPDTASSFSDSKVEKGARYEYAITALDATGNESRRSASVAGVVRDDTP